MRTVLLIAYYYPPVIETAARRAGCMAKYLPEFGWKPLVVTRQWTPENCMYDPEFVRNLPPEHVAAAVPHAGDHLHPALGAKLERFIRPDVFPSAWSTAVHQAIDTICSRRHVDAVWATCSPYSALAIADACAGRHAIPWVADFRDVPGQEGPSETPGGALRRLRFVPLEKRLIRTASAVTTVSHGLAGILKARHGRDVHVIPNGFDLEDYAESHAGRTQRFTILYTGSLIAYCDPAPLFAALDLLHRCSKISFEDLSLRFCGRSRERVPELVKPYLCRSIVSCDDTVPHARVTRLQREATALLSLSCPGGTGVLTSKIFEYLGARRPILSIPRDDDGIDALLRETGAGVSCSTAEEIAQQVLAWYQEWKRTGAVACRSSEAAVSVYSRRQQAGQLAEVLDRMTNEANSRTAEE